MRSLLLVTCLSSKEVEKNPAIHLGFFEPNVKTKKNDRIVAVVTRDICLEEILLKNERVNIRQSVWDTSKECLRTEAAGT